MGRPKKPKLDSLPVFVESVKYAHPQMMDIVRLKDEQGFSYTQIARQLDISRSTVIRVYRDAMAEYWEESRNQVTGSKVIFINRLERAIEKLEEEFEEDPTNTKLLEAIIKAQDQQAKIMGAYAAEKQEITVKELSFEEQLKAIDVEYTEVEDDE